MDSDSWGSWEAWFDEHAPALTLFARSFVDTHGDAEDVVQEAFLRFWKRGRRIARDPKAYLYQCIKRTALDFQRQKKRRKRREDLAARERSAEEALFVSFDMELENREQLELSLRELSDEQRKVLVLKIWGDLSFPQIAEALEIPINTAASRFRYALANLRKRFRERELK